MQVGNVVQLNSGSPVMTVMSIEDSKATVVWLDKRHRTREETWPVDMFTVLTRSA